MVASELKRCVITGINASSKRAKRSRKHWSQQKYKRWSSSKTTHTMRPVSRPSSRFSITHLTPVPWSDFTFQKHGGQHQQVHVHTFLHIISCCTYVHLVNSIVLNRLWELSVNLDLNALIVSSVHHQKNPIVRESALCCVPWVRVICIECIELE